MFLFRRVFFARTGIHFARKRSNASLLPVTHQHLITGGGDLGAMVLQAGQDGEIPLIHHATAQALDIAGTGLLLFRRTAALLLSHCTGGNRPRQDAECEEKLMHFVPSFLTAEDPLSSPWMGRAGTLTFCCRRPGPRRQTIKSAGKCGQICGGLSPNSDPCVTTQSGATILSK